MSIVEMGIFYNLPASRKKEIFPEYFRVNKAMEGSSAMGFVVVVDSSADIPHNLAKSAGIMVVPMPVTVNEQTFLEGVDISQDQFYSQFKLLTELPKTSQPNVHTLLEHYEKVLAAGDEVVAIHLSSGLSSTVSSAHLARSMSFKPEQVHIIDSLGASFGYGLLALSVNELLKNVKAWQELEPEILEIRQKMRYIFTPDTLEYLVKGGRISKTAGFVGGLLDIKPLLQLNSNGQIEAFGKVRSRKAAIRALIDVLEHETIQFDGKVIGISHSDCLNDAEALANEILRRHPIQDILISEIGCVIGSHTGPGTLALFYQKDS